MLQKTVAQAPSGQMKAPEDLQAQKGYECLAIVLIDALVLLTGAASNDASRDGGTMYFRPSAPHPQQIIHRMRFFAGCDRALGSCHSVRMRC